MNKNVLIVLGGAVLAAVLVAVLVQVSLGGKKGGSGSAETVQVLVASDDLKIGQEISDGDLRWQEWPKSAVFRGAIVRKKDQKASEALKGRLRRAVAKDEAVLKSFLLKEKKGNFVAASLEPGMRAMAIEVDAKTMAGGFIKPGDYVDVVLTYKRTIKAPKGSGPEYQSIIDMNINKWASETILQKIKVLAIDQTAEEDDDEDEAEVAKTVTLAVNAEQAEKLALASEFGKVTLALRGVGDDKLVSKKWKTVTDARLINIDNEVYSEYLKLGNHTGVKRNIVRVYNSSKLQVDSAK